MKLFWILLAVIAGIICFLLLTAFICFYMAFYAANPKEDEEAFSLPPGKIYEPFRDTMLTWMKETRALPHKAVSIRSFDGLTLRGKYYECAPGAPIELMMHGYRGKAERDLCGGIQRCFALGRNVLIVDQRACGDSEGHVISFGVNESRDCRAWVDYIIAHFGADVKIILTGISMGAATVIMAASQPLPENVVGILADCGYTSAREIIQKTIREMKLPAKLLFPFVKLGARIFGRFNLEEPAPIDVVKTCRIPIIFFHGETDDFVPCAMSQRNFAACSAPKQLLTVPGAGHGLSYLVDPDGYLNALADFFTRNGVETVVRAYSLSF